MKASLLTKLEALADRHQEVEALLGDAEVINDQNRFRDLSVEFAHLNDVVAQYQRWQQLQDELEGARHLLCLRQGKTARRPFGGPLGAAAPRDTVFDTY